MLMHVQFFCSRITPFAKTEMVFCSIRCLSVLAGETTWIAIEPFVAAIRLLDTIEAHDR